MDEVEQTAHRIAEWPCYVTHGPRRLVHVYTMIELLLHSVNDAVREDCRRRGRRPVLITDIDGHLNLAVWRIKVLFWNAMTVAGLDGMATGAVEDTRRDLDRTVRPFERL